MFRLNKRLLDIYQKENASVIMAQSWTKIFFGWEGRRRVDKYMDQEISIIRLTLIENKDRWFQK